MEVILVVSAMLIAVVMSSMISRALPWGIPTPLIQIALGFIIASIFHEGVTLDPEVFFLLFIPPLLFLDGWRIPKDELRQNSLGVFQLAFGMVVITVLVLGYILHWLIPSMPLVVAFALAAIVSPTDPVAVAGITRRLPVPRRIMNVLEGEGLFNDASGLVAFRMAVLAAMTGSFSLLQATKSFVWVVILGVLTGVIVTWSLSTLYRYIRHLFGSDVGADMLISFLMPFAAYVAAEHIHASGVLAAVAAGLTMSNLEFKGHVSTLTRIRRTSMWDTIQFTLNGLIFVLLGEQLPDIFFGAIRVVEQTGHHNPWWLFIYAIVITSVLVLLRFAWISLSVFGSKLLNPKLFNVDAKMRWIHIWILAFGGARGALSLAGVMTLPLLLPDNSPFPARDLAIFLTATVIIVTLVAASIALPLLLSRLPKPTAPLRHHQAQKKLAIELAQKQASQKIDELLNNLSMGSLPPGTNPEELKEKLLSEFSSTFNMEQNANDAGYQAYLLEKQMRLTILNTARETIYALARHNKISDELARQLVRQLDLNQYQLE